MAKDKKDSTNNLDSGSISKITRTGSSSSVKSKKSNSFFATIKRVMKKKSKSSDTTLKNLHVGPDMYSSSSLALNSEGKRSVFGDLQEITEVEQNFMFYNENMGDNIVNFHPVDKVSDSGTSCFVETIKSDSKLVPKSKSLKKITIENTRDIFGGLEVAQELAKKLKESENNFIQVLTKYITDQGVLQDLLDAVALHTKLFMEADRRTSSVINLIWTQKLDGWQKHERELKENLSLLVKENRELHIKNEQLFRKSEMFSKKLHNLEESQTKRKDKLERKCSCNKQLTNLLKHNEKLEEKLRGYYQQLEEYENKLAVSQIQSSILETEVRTSNGEVQLLKAKLERTRTDFNLEIVSLNVKLLSNEKIIKETIEVGDNILEDLGRIKINLKKTPLVTIDWAKLKYRGNTPVDIMALCRLYLEELSRELYAFVEKIKQNQAIIESLEKKNENLRSNLEAVQNELGLLTEKAKDSMQNSLGISDLESKIRAVEEDYKILEDEISKNKADYDEKVKAFNELVLNYESLLKEIKDKEDVILKQNLELEKIHQENCALKNEVNSLQKVLKEMGSGDNNKFNVEFPKVQSEYFQLLNDKQELLRQIEILREDNRVLLSNQQKYYEHSQKHKGEVQDLTKELQIFKHKLAVEHQTLVSLQKERKKYLEEKSTLKTIFQHMKSEMDRMQKLEGTVLDISKEANRLAVIADFNKKIGEKLKEEVANRDNTINELRDTMERLNIIQVENTKEKLSLCHELSEVCNIKDQLSDVLTQEVQKNYRLYETNKDLENTAQSQAIKFQEKELTEKEALKEIFEELKKVVKERDTLMTEQEKYIKEIKELETNFVNVQKKFDLLNAKYNKKDHKLVQLTESIKTTETSFQKTEHKLAKEILEYKNKVALMEKQNQQLKEEKLEVQNTISYLKNNSQKLHNDLNEARSHEKNIKDQLNKTELDLKTSKMENSKILEKILSLTTDKEKLISEIEYVNNLCEKVLADFETNIKTANEKEENYKKEMDEAQKIIKKYEVEVEILRKELELCRSQHPAIVTTDSPSNPNKLISILEKENNSLRREIFLKEDALKQLNEDFKKKVSELNNFQRKSKDANEKKEKQVNDLKQRISNMEEKHKEETNNLNQEIRTLNKQIADLNETLQKERKDNIPAQIYNELTAKYLTSNAELMEKNQTLQELLRTLQETQAGISSLQKEKEEMRDQINKNLNTLNHEKQLIQKLIKEKEDLSRQFSEVSTKCSILETELKDYSQSELDSTKIEYLKSTENRANLLKKELDESYDVIVTLKEEVSGYQQQVASLEFEKSELKLRLHESQGNLETEKALNQQLREANHQTLFAILQMRDDGKVGPVECSQLLVKLESAAQNPADLNSVDSSGTPNLQNVEYISQQQQDKYNEIIEEIRVEQEKCDNLKKSLQRENDKIVVKQLSGSKLDQNISLVTVKVFNDVFEIYSVYQNEVLLSDFNKLAKAERCKFYLFELYVNKSLQQKLYGFKWMLNICIRFDNICVNRTVEYSNRTPIIEVIAINEDVVDCVVETYLFLLSDDSCLKLKLHTVVTDTSYHFHTFTEKNKSHNLNRNILQINKNYNDYDVDSLRKPLSVEYNFRLNIKKEDFTKLFLQHAYHQLDLELFSELMSENKNTFTIQFSTGYNKHSVVFDQNTNIITIKCCIDDLLKLKSYFLKEIVQGVNAPRSLTGDLLELNDKISMSYSDEDLCQNYTNLRKLSIDLPL